MIGQAISALQGQPTKQGLPPLAKIIIVVGVTVGVVYLAIKVPKWIANTKNKTGAKDEVKDSKTDLAALAATGVKPTLTDTQLASIANVIQEAMSGYGDGLVRTMQALGQLNNDADMLALIRVYGTRTVKSGHFNIFTPDYTGSMSGAFSTVYSATEMDAINKTLALKGIKFKF